mmetsp:Transcript_24054/g.67389  ORF Transcript_24054/g.67389 Transcript_24054/m.67389 type:complete len:218 (-) Transcript_24054:15-668(-)
MRRTFSPAIAPASLVACRWASLKYAGTVTTACVTFLPRYASAVSFIFCRTMADTSSGARTLSSPLMFTWTFGLLRLFTILNGSSFASFWTVWSLKSRPIRRLISYSVFSGLRAAWFLAASPIRRSFSENATYDGVIRLPRSLAIISTRPFLKTPTQLYVVPKSIPITVPYSDSSPSSSSSSCARTTTALNTTNTPITTAIVFMMSIPFPQPSKRPLW